LLLLTSVVKTHGKDLMDWMDWLWNRKP
jgi:hypothetical protein